MGKIKKAVRAMIIYIVLTVGVQMFMYAYVNSYNRMTDKKIEMASLIVNEENAELQILNKSYVISLNEISAESRLYYFMYLVSPDELRAELPLFLAFLP